MIYGSRGLCYRDCEEQSACHQHLDRDSGAVYAVAVDSLDQTVQPPPAGEINRPKPPQPKPGAIVHPLGPVVYRVAARRPVRARLIAGFVLTGCVTLLSTAASLTPAATGMGSHRQLGYPACTWVVLFGYPCPTCGMTTAFAHTVRGQLTAAWSAQPAGLVLALGTILATSVSLSVLFTGKVWAVNWYRVSPTWVMLAAILLIAGGWIYKLAVGVISGALPVGG